MRRWILRIHLYGGLLCSPYLLVLGFSSLRFNHVSEAPASEVARTWEAPLPIEPAKDDDSLAASARDSLGLIGWPVRSKVQRDVSGNLQFDLEQPGKSYLIHVDLANHRARVEERSKGFWQIIDALHSTTWVPNSIMASAWGVFIEGSVAFTVFAMISGVWLWMRSRRERFVGIATLAAACVFSVGLMIYVAWKG